MAVSPADPVPDNSPARQEAVKTGLRLTLRAIETLLGLGREGAKAIKWYNQLGYHGYSIEIHPLHLEYFSIISGYIHPNEQFHRGLVDTWKVLNSILFRAYQTEQGESIGLSSMAAFMAFPLLEEVCRTCTQRWDQDGRLQTAIEAKEGVVKWNEGGSTTEVTKSSGSLISSLSIKYQLLLKVLQPATRLNLERLEKAMMVSPVDGIACIMSPLHARLYYWRNQWMHGARYQGWEAVLVSLLLAIIYFSEEVKWS